ncbi:4a-hydroxytetrahydrobiopterin dehydratase [Rhodohalobacter sp. SW132]|uniref:4a-hydroxytetrahydrobiopterin dehydratase n=1 Tax=Rhodohalobacter sp. SW132 TaxID=2293433 RepID=UPI000E285355|nr:4a-hydroxytetrahydrobiopterin dehydratase [Rhodohalobacter sp. SW132]REL33581.1 4a-hydroxytetrahydrobiopterin dehydratase [Rhodohalobacter sp. SW132]
MKPLTEKEIQTELKNLNDWNFTDDKIHREFSFEDFKTALSFIVRVGFDAEDQGHHPELFNVYNTVQISLATHDAGDKVTGKDIKLAKAIDAIYKTF